LRIKIKEGSSAKYSDEYGDMLKAIEGKWVEVDLEYLFTSQFNTVAIPGVSQSGMRIYDGDVQAIEGDERVGRSRCGYCGMWADTGQPCEGCTKGTDEMQEFFPGTSKETGVKVEVKQMLDGIFNI